MSAQSPPRQEKPCPAEPIGSAPAGARLRSTAARARLRRIDAFAPKHLWRRLMRSVREAFLLAVVDGEVTVMFTDIAGFTAMAAGRPAAVVADFLNDHFALVAACIEAESGVLDKFIGDGVMAYWEGSPKTPDHAIQATRAALAIADAIRRDNGRRVARGEAPVRLRIGLHSGPAVIGALGAPSRMARTVIGETVNIAQRLEQLGKAIAGADDEVTILASEAVAAALGGCFPAYVVPPLQVGHAGALLHVYALGSPPGAERDRPPFTQDPLHNPLRITALA